MPKTLILYIFHKVNSNVNYFINNCIFEDDRYDFILIQNSLEDFDLNIPSFARFVKRENIGFDFGGYSDILLTDDLYLNYSHFVFVNSSVIGPLNAEIIWPEIFINMLNDEVKLSGVAINCGDVSGRNIKCSGAHIQSYVFATDIIGMQILIEECIFTKNYITTFRDVIIMQEIRMSRVIINRGFNIACLMDEYKNCDFRSSNFEAKGDIMFPTYINSHIDILPQLVFIKNNRGKLSHDVLKKLKNLKKI